MINQIHQALLRPEKGWDPVPASHAAVYAPFAWAHVRDEGVIDRIEDAMGRVAGKKVLDLGGGPGQYSVAFARRGANVTWHDVSAVYQSFSMAKAAVSRSFHFLLAGLSGECPSFWREPVRSGFLPVMLVLFGR